MNRVLHLIERLGRGGAARSLLAQAQHVGRRCGTEQTIVSLLPPVTGGLELARRAGVAVMAGVPAAAVEEAVAAADITHVHFWNTPEMYAWLRGPIPPARLLLTLHVAGEHPAQVLTQAVLDHADFVAVTTPYSLRLPLLGRMPAAARADKVAVVLGSPDFERLQGARRRESAGFSVGYVGTVSFVKMHPHYIAMSAAARIPEGRFLVAGDGDAIRLLQRQAAARNASGRFEWLGYVEDVASVLERCDVFGYPLCADTYATGELVLQEAMYAGVPPVVLAHGAPATLVVHGETGLVARDEQEYTRGLERLFQQPAERHRLAANAAAFAHDELGADKSAAALAEVYERLMQRPKRERGWATQRLSAHRGADAFVEALGEAAPYFRASLLAEDEAGAREAEKLIASASPCVTDAAAGGVLHYRRFYAEDAFLRLWSGLVLLARGRPALAAAEFQRAVTLGMAPARVAEYLADSLLRAR